MAQLAVNGGAKGVPDGTIKKWPPIEKIDRDMVMSSLNGDNHAFGPNCKAFEKEFAEWNHNSFAITTNSGTAALHMCIAASGCSAGDHVLVPAYSWSSSATCILHHNCIPIFVDIDYDTMNIDPGNIEEAITSRTKAIVVVHLHGLGADMDAIMRIAQKHDLRVIEDACQAHGARINTKKTGTAGDCAAFSFNQNKCLCSGEGGMFVTDNKKIYENARTLWSFGENRTPSQSRDYHAYALGWMYRNNDLTAAFGRAQLTRLDSFIETQRKNAAELTQKLRNINGLVLPFEPETHKHTYYNFTCRLEPKTFGWNAAPGIFRDAVLKALQAEGVDVGIWQKYILPEMTVFKAQNAYGRGCPWECVNTEPVEYDPDDYPAAQTHCQNHFGMTMPLRSPNGVEQVRIVAQAMKKVFDNINEIVPEKILETA